MTKPRKPEPEGEWQRQARIVIEKAQASSKAALERIAAFKAIRAKIKQ